MLKNIEHCEVCMYVCIFVSTHLESYLIKENPESHEVSYKEVFKNLVDSNKILYMTYHIPHERAASQLLIWKNLTLNTKEL